MPENEPRPSPERPWENGWTPEDVKRESDRVAFLDLTDLQNPYFRYTS